MNEESRTSKSIKNAKVALVFYFVNLVLQFFSRKVFLDCLGAEVLGLNTTAQNLLGFLNLAELGIGSAVSYMLYKPLFEGNREVINEIVSVQGWMYRKIAWVVVAGACVLMCFFPWIFEKAEVPLWYAYGSFMVLLVGALLGYFVNYRQIVLTADQKEYKITLNIQGFKVAKVIFQILAVRYLSDGYVWWMGLELMMAFVTVVVLDKVLKRNYPWLRNTPREGKRLKEKYPEIITKTKQVFFHRIGAFVLQQTSPLIIYAYASLTLVAVYGNYMLIVVGVTLLMNALLNSVGAGVGNLVAEGNRKAIKRFFWELTSCRVWMASVICFGIYELADSFIALWVGEEYVMDESALYVLIAITFIGLTRTNDTFLAAYGLYRDIWAPIVEAALNLGLSVLLGYFWGLTGILSGVLISLVLIVCIWKPYFLYKYGFKESVREYAVKYTGYLGILGVSVLGSGWMLKYLVPSGDCSGYRGWMIHAAEVMVVYVFVSFVVFYCFNQGMRDFMARVKRIVGK